MGDPVVRWQILSRHPEQTAQFYAALFGWQVSADNAMGYREVATGAGKGIDGGIWPAPPEAPNFVQLFMQVDDIDAHVDRAVSLGARVLIPAQTLPEGDRMAILLDPQGMSFGLHQAGPAGGSIRT